MAPRSTGSPLHVLVLGLLVLAGWPEAEAVDRTLLAGESGAEVVDAVIRLIQQACILYDDHFLLRRIAFTETGDGTYARTYSNPGNNGGIWQVDSSMLAATQQGGESLSSLYRRIKERFGIDWPSVTWSELRKPLYSGLAAALYVLVQSGMTVSQVPVNPESQASFLKSKYDSSLTPYNYTLQIDNIPTGCAKAGPIDVVVLLDGTISGDDFERAKLQLQDLAQRLPIGPSGVRMGMIQYSTGFEQTFRLDTHISASQLASAIGSMAHTTGGSIPTSLPAKTATAVRFAVDSLFPPSKGGRPFAAKLILVVTDTLPQNQSQLYPTSQYALQHGVGVYGLTVGTPAKQAVRPLLTPPSCAHDMHIDSYHDIKYLTQQLLYTICNAPRYSSGTVTCPLESCPVFAFTSTDKGITLEGNVTCGSTNLYAAYINPFPGRVYFGDTKTVATGAPVELFVVAPSVDHDFLYVRLPDAGQAPGPGCVATLTPYTGDHTDHTINVICEKDGHSWNCNATDLPKSLVDQICNGTIFKQPANPCTLQNMASGQLKFPDPFDSRKFIECDLTGKPYVTQCPENEVYSAECQYCRGPNSPSLTNCNTPLTGALVNPCTVDNIINGHYFFAYPGDDTRYIQCDVWGHPFIRQCQTGFVWKEEALTCEHPYKYNPCATAHFGQRFFAHPDCNFKFMECNAEHVSFEMSCPSGEVWNDLIKTCVPADGLRRHCGGYQPVTNMPRVTTPRPIFTQSPLPAQGGRRCGAIFAPPCTRDNINANRLFHPHVDPHRYLQCDLNGNCYEKSCFGSDSYDPYSHTCVDGPVHVDCPDHNSPNCIHNK